MQPASPTIHKDLELADGLDYARLRAEGISLLQKLSGGIWTDYNDHDPGVTILEALCYALTDLTNRASQPIPDLLAPPPGSSPDAQAVGSVLTPAHQVFANHPVTLHDYKKILLDQRRFWGILHSVWIEPGQEAHHLAGEYTVRVGLRQNQHYPALAQQARAEGRPAPSHLPPNHAQLRHDILRTLNRYRNLSEEFVEVVFLEPYCLSVGGSLELQMGQAPEDALADVLWHINNYFAPALSMRGLRYLQSINVGAEDIFAGPQLENQLMQESQFQPQHTTISTARLNSLLNRLDSIRNVSDLHLFEPGHAVPSDLVQLTVNQEFVLDLENSISRWHTRLNGVSLPFNAAQVLHKFAQLHHNRNKSVRSAIPKTKLRFEEPVGRFQNLGHYDSIQHSFPTIYGLGEAGPPLGASPAQRAQSLQLKGYLLFFEQIMANFCAQLANVGAQLSARAQPPSYFAQPLFDVPHLHRLLNDIGQELTEEDHEDQWVPTNSQDAARTTDSTGAPISQRYQRQLVKLANDPAGFNRQRESLLTHLLARFGYSVSTFHPLLTTPEGARKYGIQLREHLLQHLNTATYHRGAARVAAPEGTPDVSGLELFLYLLTGVRYFQLIAVHEQQLVKLESQVQLPGAMSGPETVVEVRGAQLDFSTFLRVMQRQLTTPTLVPLPDELSPQAVQVSIGGRQLEFHFLPTPETHSGGQAERSPQHAVLNYFRQLDDHLNRFILIDHRTLKPAAYDHEAATPPDGIDRSFYECQVSICLAGFTRQFQPTSTTPDGLPTYSYREYVHNLLLTYAPAHLLVNVIWLDYAPLQELEILYEGFVAASGLLSPHTDDDHADLSYWQQALAHFLIAQHLS